MHLFKRILLSLFPDEIVHQTINPASMFVSFINAKQFFSVVNRKIVENYKLNLFDISLDPFEVKIGFGETPTIKVKDVDFYYGYASSANFNGYRFFSPSNLATSIALVTSISTKSAFTDYDPQYFLYFLFSVYLLTFLFEARLKIFPSTDPEENYRWFIELFFNFYHNVLEQAGLEVEPSIFATIQKKLLNNIQVFFMLYYFYQHISNSIYPYGVSDKEFYGWLFYDELKKGDFQPIVQDFVEHHQKYTRQPGFSLTEKKIMHLVLPADILLRYLVEGDDIFLITQQFSTSIYDKEKLDAFMRSFLTNGDQFRDFMMYISDYTHFKKNYFAALKKYLFHAIKPGIENDDTYGNNTDIDELLSSIGDTTGMDSIHVPQRLKKEAEIMERMMNFYVTFVGGFWIARGDTFYLRLCKPELIELVSTPLASGIKQDALYYYGGLLYHYSKNVFYYKYAFENIRAGKEKFHLPFRATFREVYSNMFIIKLFDINAIATLLQDINPRDTKIYVKNKQITSLFKDYFSENISAWIHMKDDELKKRFYTSLGDVLTNIPSLTDQIAKQIIPEEIGYLKENLYSVDVQLFQSFLSLLLEKRVSRQSKYSDYSIMGILASLKDTLLGCILYSLFLEQEARKEKIDIRKDLFMKIYIIDILNIAEEYHPLIVGIIDELSHRREDLWSLWRQIDDNVAYFQIGYENRKHFIAGKDTEDIMGGVAGEDIIRLRGYLKNIVYYNKRFLIPKG